MKIVVVLLVLCVALTASVVLTGEYVILQYVASETFSSTFRVGGVIVQKPNDHIIMNATNTFSYTIVHCLVMDYNILKYLPGHFKRFFPDLAFVIARNARVKYLTNDDFSGLKNLRHVNFRNNEIEHLPGNLFQGVSKILTTVLLMNNKIINVGPNFIANIPGLKYLHLVGNPCTSLNSPATFSFFTTTFRTKCQQQVTPDVITVPPPTYEEHNALNMKRIDLMNQNEILEAELKLNNDRVAELEQIYKLSNNNLENNNKLKSDLKICKSSKNSLQNELITTENRLQTIKLMKIINKKKT